MEQAEYLELLIQNRMILGTFDPDKVSGLIPQWFWDRRVRLIDFRGDLQIRSAMNITFGFDIAVYTASHDFSTGGIGEVMIKPVWIDECVFVGSSSVLYACHLQHHSIVSMGSVVRNMVVEPYTLVEGNPARPVAKYVDGHWVPIR